MASENVKLGLALVFLTMICGKATAQSGCPSVLLSLAPCLNYITGNSTTPASSCCSQLSSVVQSQPKCLCLALNSGGSLLGITINQTQALSLPGACNVQTPPVSACNAADSPAAPPAAPPASSEVSPPADSPARTPATPATSSTPSIPSGTGSKTVPRTDSSLSNGSIMKMPLITLTLFTLFIASYISSIALY